MSDDAPDARATDGGGAAADLTDASAEKPGPGSLSADPVSEAAAPASMLDQLLAVVQAGGPVVVLLLVLSVIATTIVAAKLLQFRAARLGDRRAAREAVQLYRDGRVREALGRAEGSRNPVARTVALAIHGLSWGVPEPEVREEAACHAADHLEALRAWFRPLEVIAGLAPLLGLFGTVLGMIEAFRQLEEAGNQVNPAILSGGIWEALLTTAVGLAVAIPVVALLNWLERRVERTAHEMDSVVPRIFTQDLFPASEGSVRHEPAAFRPAVAAAG